MRRLIRVATGCAVASVVIVCPKTGHAAPPKRSGQPPVEVSTKSDRGRAEAVLTQLGLTTEQAPSRRPDRRTRQPSAAPATPAAAVKPHVMTQAEREARLGWLVVCGPSNVGAFDGLPGADAAAEYCEPDTAAPAAPATPGRPAPPVNVGYLLMQQARASVVPPKPLLGGAPPLTVDQLVGFPTWLWTTNFDPIENSVSLAGITATVRAEPATTTWVFTPRRTDVDVDTQTVVCDGPSRAWDPDRGEDQTSDCTHRFEWSGTYDTEATTTYTVTWTTTDGQAGSLPDLTAATTITIPVEQAQAVIR